MTIRIATVADMDALVALILRLGHESTLTNGAVVDVAHTTETVGTFLRSPMSVFIVAEQDGALVGVLALVCYPHLLSGEQRLSELCWWMNPEHRGHGNLMMVEAIAWAKAHGVVSVEMLAPDGRFARYYTRLGFEPRSRVYERRV